MTLDRVGATGKLAWLKEARRRDSATLPQVDAGGRVEEIDTACGRARARCIRGDLGREGHGLTKFDGLADELTPVAVPSFCTVWVIDETLKANGLLPSYSAVMV